MASSTAITQKTQLSKEELARPPLYYKDPAKLPPHKREGPWGFKSEDGKEWLFHPRHRSSFGKYKGMRWADLIELDPDYCMWLLKSIKGPWFSPWARHYVSNNLILLNMRHNDVGEKACDDLNNPK